MGMLRILNYYQRVSLFANQDTITSPNTCPWQISCIYNNATLTTEVTIENEKGEVQWHDAMDKLEIKIVGCRGYLRIPRVSH